MVIAKDTETARAVTRASDDDRDGASCFSRSVRTVERAEMTSPAGCRILIVSNIPTPYNDSLYAHLARQPGLALHVAYGATRESNRQWRLETDKGYPYVILPGVTTGPIGRFNPGVFGLLRRFAPNVVLLTGSYAYPTIQVLSWWLCLRGIRWFYWGEELNWEKVSVARRLVRLFRRPLRAADGILANGERAAESFRRLGIAGARIHVFHYYADTGRFTLTADRRAAERARIRKQLAILPDATAVLFIGEIVRRKGLDTLVRAMAGLTGDASALLIVAGDGGERREIYDLARRLGVLDRIRFAGYVQPAELPSYTAAADALVVPSRKEGWGVVVAEAMAAGLPVIASARVNSAADLLREGESGFFFPVDDVPALVSVLTRVVRSPALRASVAKRARDIVAGEQSSPAAARLRGILCEAEPDTVRGVS